MKNGFSLIELVIIVSVMAVIMVTVTSVMVSSLTARTRVETGDRLEESGNAALAEIRNNFLNSNGKNVSCLLNGAVGVGDSISFTNQGDGVQTTLHCGGGQLASESALVSRWLTSQDVIVNGCNTFVTCDTLPSSGGQISVANFSFLLSTGSTDAGAANFITRKFETKVVVRN